MKIDLFDINKFIETNHCKQVTDPIFFDGASGNPREGGLFSYDIFGMTDIERRNLYGYIDLGANYLHPLVFSTMNTRMGSIRDVLSGKKYAKIVNGKLTITTEEDPEGKNGISFIYDNWDNIDWINSIDEEEIDSLDKKTRLKFFKSLKKNEAFCNKWLVMPVFYRDMKPGGKNMGSEINETYKSLIAKTNSMKLGGKYSIFGNTSMYSIQLLLVKLFEENTRHIRGKDSMIRKHMIGKSLDFSSSNVITSQQISAAETVDDAPAKFGYTGLPLPTLLATFQPFFVNKIVDLYDRILVPNVYTLYGADVKHLDRTKYNVTAAEKLIKMFIKAETNRYMPITIEYDSIGGSKQEVGLFIYESPLGRDQFVKRPFTLADLIYLSALECLNDKHVYITRYPITNNQNIYPSKIKILTTAKTHDVSIKFDKNAESIDLKSYPYIAWDGDPHPAPKSYYTFEAVTRPDLKVLASLGADFDGDTLAIRGVFSKEANAEAEELIMRKSNFFSSSGRLSRSIGGISKEATMSLYELTK